MRLHVGEVHGEGCKEQTWSWFPRRHRVFKLATIWLTASVVLLIVPLIYRFCAKLHSKEKLSADTLLKVDYSGVITESERIDPAKLPNTQSMMGLLIFRVGIFF